MIQFKTTTDYLIRALLYLYIKREQQAVRAEEIAREMQIPLNYLHTIIAYLKKANYVQTVFGKHGGYRIVEPADEISLYHITKLSETKKVSRCMEQEDFYTDNGYGVCAVAQFYALAREYWENKLKEITLKLLAAAPDKDKLREVLEM